MGEKQIISVAVVVLMLAQAGVIHTGSIPKSALKAFFGVECFENSECKSNQMCESYLCTTPCPFNGTSPICGNNSRCYVRQHEISCLCLPGFNFAKGDTPTCTDECVTDDDCRELPWYKYSCQNFHCESLCSVPCGVNAFCGDNSSACECEGGYKGDPNISCTPECYSNTDCPDARPYCFEECIDPCLDYTDVVCGVNAKCKLVDRQAICYCPEGFIGNPRTQCNQTTFQQGYQQTVIFERLLGNLLG